MPLSFSSQGGHDRTHLSSGQQQQQLTIIPTGLPIPLPSPDPQARADYFSAPILPPYLYSIATTTQVSQATSTAAPIAMASSQPQSFPAHASIPNMGQQAMFDGFNTYSAMPNSFYESFTMLPAQLPMQMNQQQSVMAMQNTFMLAPQQQQQQQVQQRQAQSRRQSEQPAQQQQRMMAASAQHMSRQDSAEYDEDDDEEGEGEEDNSEVMIPKDDIETRLRVAQAAQDAAASEGSNGVFACPYCDKQYAGKHARSIWRRHLQDKHAIPLSQQPRRTRWDGDANRPKNAEERRQRMLESKRRWARKKRQAEKAGGKAGMSSEEPMRDMSSSEPVFQEVRPSATILQQQHQQQTQAPTKKRSSKPKGPQQLKFHNITQSEMPTFVDFGGTSMSGGGGMLWPTASDGSFIPSRDTMAGLSSRHSRPVSSNSNNGSTLASAHNFRAKGGQMVVQQQSHQQTIVMTTSLASPRKALSQIDSNTTKGRRYMRQSLDSSMFVDQRQQSTLKGKAHMASASPQMTVMDMNKMTPMNRFAQLYPTPPSVGDAGSGDAAKHEMRLHAARSAAFENNSNAPLLSPPASQHTGESSPSYLGFHATGATSTLGKRSSAGSIFASTVSKPDVSMPRSPVDNPFSLDRHKISPTTATTRKSLSNVLQPPTSASRLTSAIGNDIAENKLSPIQTRTGKGEGDVNRMAASPLDKNRKLPSLVKTPLRSFKIEDAPTPSTAMDLIGGLGSVSVRRIRSSNSLPATGTGSEAWKLPLLTPGEEHSDRMLGGASLPGFTPLNVKSAKYSMTRGLASVSRPSRDGGDQFSSPQHLNLTQSLGLAPHSTSKSGYGGINATPYIGSFLNGASPWPDSVMRPTFRTSASKRGQGDNRSSDSAERLCSNDDDEDDDDDDDDEGGSGQLYVHETPSRPAKHLRPTLLGSGQSISTTGRSSSSNRLPSSSARDSGPPVKPINFAMSPSKSNEPKRVHHHKQESSQDSDLTSTGQTSSLLSMARTPSQSDDGSGDEPQSPSLGPKKRKLA